MISWLAFGAPKQKRLFAAAPGYKHCVTTLVLLLVIKKPCYVQVNAIFSLNKIINVGLLTEKFLRCCSDGVIFVFEIRCFYMSLCDFYMIASSWSGPRAPGPWPGLRAQGSLFMSQWPWLKSTWPDANQQKAGGKGQSSWAQAVFSRPWISSWGCKNIAICI